MDREALQRATAEFVGTFALVFIGVGSIVVSPFGSGLVGIALAHGLTIAVMASAVGHISGAHFNPAVTLGFLVTRRMEPALALVYWVSQFAAATAAALLLSALMPDRLADLANLGAPQLGALGDEAGIGAGAGLVLEIVLTFFLVWVIFATAADPRGTFKSIAGLAIGLTITADILIGGPLTGAAMNPARAFGPELVHNAWDDFWVWYVGPLVGGTLAALAYEFLYLRPVGPEPVGDADTGLLEPRPGDTAAS
ncbi:MAG: aquaporin [Actinobacteria bacterium]|nr:aquaporin [Actinomycetota bacterium]